MNAFFEYHRHILYNSYFLDKTIMLNKEQQAAVKHVSGPLLVMAGAGSGKTRVITYKIKHLIENCGFAPHSIYAVTFTNKAAIEMKTRITSLLEKSNRFRPKISTFHTLGLNILKHNPQLFNLGKNFSILDNEDCFHLIKDMLPANSDKDYVAKIQQIISQWKNNLQSFELITPENLTEPIFQVALELYPRYVNKLRSFNAVDFDDLLYLPVQGLEKNSDIQQYWQKKIKYLLVDEYQDTNLVQYRMVQLLAGPPYSFTVVGDEDQSIYAWRGARPENLAQLKQDYPNLSLIKLEQNYRSTDAILKVANHLIKNNPHWVAKNLWSLNVASNCPKVIYCKDEQDETEKIIYDLMNHKLKTGANFNDYAILYRSNHQARPFEKILQQHMLPYQISGGQSWFAKKEIKDMLAYLKLLTDQPDDAAFLRIINTPKRGIGENTLAALSNYACKINQSLYYCCDHFALKDQIEEKPRASLIEFKKWISDLKKNKENLALKIILRKLLEESGYESYLYTIATNPNQAQKCIENIFSLFEWVERLMQKEKNSCLQDVLNTFILLDVLDKSNQDNLEAIQLLTLHAAKGLEFPYVYLVGLEEGNLPHQACTLPHQIEEERRLLYVGITRAETNLTLTLAEQRKKEGSLQTIAPSRFLTELPEGEIEWLGKAPLSKQQTQKIASQYLADIKKQLEKTIQ